MVTELCLSSKGGVGGFRFGEGAQWPVVCENKEVCPCESVCVPVTVYVPWPASLFV